MINTIQGGMITALRLLARAQELLATAEASIAIVVAAEGVYLDDGTFITLSVLDVEGPTA